MLFANNKKFRLPVWFGLAILAFSILLSTIYPLTRTGYNFSIDYNEGWNVYHGLRAISGERIYDIDNKWTPTNYPPFSFYIVGSIGKIIGNPLIAGRYVSLISLLVICFGIGYIVKSLGGNNIEVLFGSVFCLGLFIANALHYVGMNDPQMLGHVFMIGALIIYLRNRISSRILFGIAFIICFGLFTKHNLIPIAIVITLDIFIKSRTKCFKFLLYLALILGVFLLFIYVVMGTGFLDQLLISREYSLKRVLSRIMGLGINMQTIIIAIIPWSYYAMKNDRLKIIPIYLAISAIIGIFFSGGSGCDINMFFDLFIAISIAAGMLLLYVRTEFQHVLKHTQLIYTVLPLILGFSILLSLPKTFTLKPSNLANEERMFLSDASFVERINGPALCENILMCYFGKKDFQYDPFLVREMIVNHSIDEDEVLRKIESSHFSVIQLENIESGSFTKNIQRSLGRYYKLVRRTGNRAFYIPINTETITTSSQK